MRAILVSHTHWDREWHHEFESFRARLVDAVDRVLDFCERDPGYRFLLDGQSIVLEDYLDVRPERREALRAAAARGQLEVGPWYVQPDSLLPSGEAHLRNLLEGRRVAAAIAEPSQVAYTPDSFGHPAQFPQLLAGFGCSAFVFWRGLGDEVDTLPAEFEWVAADGTSLLACHLGRGYFSAATRPGADLGRAGVRIAAAVAFLAGRTQGSSVLLMNGIDHALPEPRTAELAASIAKQSGCEVTRGGLGEFVASVSAAPGARHRGPLLGATVANLLPGVWSSRTWIKLANRRCEALLEGWAEPWCALAERFGLRAERASLRRAWRSLLPNQAHDSICGCSRDEVHEQMKGRFATAAGLASETRQRVLERLAGLGAERCTPWNEGFDLAVFNPSPRPRSDVVRFELDPHPYAVPGDGSDLTEGLHPVVLGSLREVGYAIDGEPARVVPAAPGRLALLPDRPLVDVEFPVADVPAFGWKRVRLEPAERVGDAVDAGREIAAGATRVRALDDGRFDVELGGRLFAGLGAVEETGDRGDSYDFDPAGERRVLDPDEVRIERRRHPNGLERLRIERHYRVPASLAPGRDQRSDAEASLRVESELRVAPGVERVDCRLVVHDDARDHRVRWRFPTGAPVERFEAATTFDVARCTPGRSEARRWIHPAPPTFVHQGWVHVSGLTLVAPGLPEAEVEPDGTIALTLLRATGWLSRHDLASRPGPAGPATETPGGQCPEPVVADLSLFAGLDSGAARAAELGLHAVAAGGSASLPAGRALLALSPADVLLSALKPAESGDGMIVRLLNPTNETLAFELRIAFPFEAARSVRLDETPIPLALDVTSERIRGSIGPHAMRSIWLSAA